MSIAYIPTQFHIVMKFIEKEITEFIVFANKYAARS